MSRIHQVNFQRLDFRQLELFSTVMRLRSVTDAALALDMPQASASHGLARLREMFRDELFVRSPRGMQPTQAALAIAEIVDQILRMGAQLEQLHGDFDPCVAERSFSIVASDVGQLYIVPRLLAALKPYPKITIRAVPVPRGDLLEALEAGIVDLVFGPYPDLVGGIKQQTLYREPYAVFCRPDHPFVRNSTFEEYCSAQHVLASGRNAHHAHRIIETRLREILPEDAIRLVTEYFVVALYAAAESGLLLTAPTRVMTPAAKRLGLEIISLPFELPILDVKQYWHIRNDHDAGHRWLRNTVHSLLGGEAGVPSLQCGTPADIDQHASSG
jgi:DNA-binding transcriptional LysR family regulator